MDLLLPGGALFIWTIFSFAAFALSIFAVIKIVSNEKFETNEKIMWLLIVFFMPVFGPIIYFFVRSREI